MDRKGAQSLHPMLIPAPAWDYGREVFWDDLIMYLESEVRPPFRQIYEREIHPALVRKLGREPERREIAAAMREVEQNRWWYLLRTEGQREGYEATRMTVEKQIPQLLERARASSNGPGSLTLDPTLARPSYLAADIHLQRGGYFGLPETQEDLTAGAVYERGITLGRMGTQGWLNDDAGFSLAVFLKDRYPAFKPKRILELGCTVGHTLTPMKQSFPDAEAHGIDVSAAVLRYAFARSASMGLEIYYHQQNAERTTFADQSFDLVFSRILMHETSAEAAPKIFAECHRLLRPGGIMFHSDGPQFDLQDPYSQTMRDWDANVNKEPFMDGFYSMDLKEAFTRAGFDPKTFFREEPPSLLVKQGKVDPKRSRARGGLYFLAGAVRT